MEWESPHIHGPKDRDWFASLIIITGALVFVAALMHDYILMLLIVALAGAIIAHHAKSHRRPAHVQIVEKGILYDDHLFAWENLESFAIIEFRGIHRLVCMPSRILGTLLSIPISDNIDLETLFLEVSDHIPHDKDLQIPILHLIFERFGI